MSATLRFAGSNLKDVCLIYDFTQVSDSILLILYNEKIKKWKRFFIHNVDGIWETEVIKRCVPSKIYINICDKLKFVFTYLKNPDRYDGKNLEQTMQNHATLLLGLSS